jgi:hypothetical protein
MTQLTILDAAKFANRDRKSIYRAIKQGKLTATTATDGALQVDVTELIRVYGESKTKFETGDSGATETPPQPATVPVDAIRLAVLEIENQQLRERLEDMRTAMQLLNYDRQAAKKPWWKF